MTTTEVPWCIITELCELGDLKELMQTLHRREFILNCEEKLRLLGNIAAGMHYLALRQFIHRVSRAGCSQLLSAVVSCCLVPKTGEAVSRTGILDVMAYSRLAGMGW